MTLQQLATKICWDKSFIARVERGDRRPRLQFVKDCDAVLAADGALIATWTAEQGALTPAQLPAPPRRFIGRHPELSALDAAVNDAQTGALDGYSTFATGEAGSAAAPLVIAIDGPPGCGKTGLALHWAHRAKAAWPDGQLYVDLRGFAPDGYPATTPSAVLEAFCRALGADTAALPQLEHELAAHYRSLVAGRRLLILLDNALDAAQVLPLLPGTSSCTVLVTSRRVLSELTVHVDAHRLHLSDLSEDDARQLLANIVGDGPAAAEPEAVTELMKLTGRTPLALRIAAERAAADHGHAIAELVDDLRAAADRLDGLDGTARLHLADGQRDDPSRHAEEMDADHPEISGAIRAVFSWSYRALPAPAARLFRLLGLFGGPTISIDAAAALADLDFKSTRAIMRVLHHANLVEPAGRERVAYHALIRTYAYELAHRLDPAEDRVAAVRRLTTWYVHTAHKASQALGPSSYPLTGGRLASTGSSRMTFDADTALEWFDAELPNMVPITRLMISTGPVGAAWQFCAGTFGYLHRRKPWTVWRHTHELAMIISEFQAEWHGYALVTTSFAEAQRLCGQLADAQHLYDRALTISTDHKDPHNTARALAGCAYLALDCNLADAARDYARRALNLARDNDNPTGEAVARIALARALSHRKRFEDARRLLINAIHALRRAGDIHRTALAIANFAELAAATGNFREAADRFCDAATYAAQASDHWSEARYRARRGDILHQLGNQQDARAEWLRALDYFRAVDDAAGRRETLMKIDRLS